MIKIDNLRFRYRDGGFRLHIPELSVGDRDRLAIVGPSGSGKTTLLNLIAGILVPDEGSVLVADTDVTALPDAERRRFRASQIGFVFQDFALLDYLSARQNIYYPFRISPALKLDAEAREMAQDLADACGIGDKLDRHPNALSQGEQQRVAICRALVTRPKLILSDEATGNLDPDSKARILELLFEQSHKAGAAVLAVTHDHELLPRFERVLDFAQFRERVAS
ncbi:MAG: ABC transporter ATP-binding protein [Rhodobacteraceae bacterium]|nr:ABC transporter ATP-binding protein [Paracoccaceae bacterium]